MDESVKVFKRMLVETFVNYCDSGFYTLKYHLLDHTVKDLRRFGKLSVLGSTPYERFNVHIKQAYRRTSRRRPSRMMEPVNVLQERYKRALSSRFEEMSATLGLRDERYARAEQNGPYLVCDDMKITMGELSRAVSDCAETGSGSRFAARLMDLFKESTMQSFMALVREVAEKS